MSDTKFTPGEWTPSCLRNGAFRHIQADYRTICYGDILQDDANLIAAAPRLYRALEELSIHAEHWCPPHSEIVAEAKAALAAARGEHD